MKQEILEQLKNYLKPGNVLLQESMKQHTTFRTGGNAEVFAEITDAGQLQKCLALLSSSGEAFFVLGNGSNLLVSDEGYEGCILHMGSSFGEVCTEGLQVKAQSGASLAKVAQSAATAGLSGMEFASGIPGSVGGAVMMNAGAYDGEMSQVVKRVEGFQRTGEAFSYGNAEMAFGYRTSILKESGAIVTEVTYELQPGKTEEIKEKMADLNQRRRSKQPLEYPSAGSTFKRPQGNFAGKLIMDAGLRGFQIGGAQVSEKHCGFLINTGNATSTDVWKLMQAVRQRVYEQSGVMLEPEVIRLGRFPQ